MEVSPIDEHQHEGEAIVKYDFIPEKTFELQLRKVLIIVFVIERDIHCLFRERK